MVPKTAEIENPSVHKGLLATLKAALRRVTGHLVAAGTVTTAAAQESTNAETAGQSTAPVQGTPAATTPGTYVVKSGDTITRIASSTGVTILNLEKANGLTQTSVLQVGEKLTIPAKEETPATVDASIGAAPQAPATAPVSTTNAPATTAADAVTANMTDYTVVKGDNPYKIARKFKISTVELMKANNITDPKKIQIGQKLKIPASTKVAK
jgi:peptidoglycan endopeptidase LytF